MDFRTYHETDDDDEAVFTIQMFALNERGETCSIRVDDFCPWFYCRVPDTYTRAQKEKLFTHVKSMVGKQNEDAVVKCDLVRKKKLDGFNLEREVKFVKFSFKNFDTFRKARNMWYYTPPADAATDRSWVLKPKGYFFDSDYLQLYEANIPPLLRFFHVRNISPTGWVRLENAQVLAKTTTCMYEFSVTATGVHRLERESGAPYKICSFDIEASSSHGDFPLPVKDYAKLALNLVEHFEAAPFSEEHLRECVEAAFSFGFVQGIAAVFPKTPVDAEAIWGFLDELVSTPMNLCGGDAVAPVAAVESDSEEEELETLPTDLESMNLLQIMASAEKAVKVRYMTRALNHFFPPLEGDKVTFIGSTFVRTGTPRPYLNHCIVLGGCAPVENAEIQCCATEREVLLAWTKLIQREDPDIVIGYNIFGFDISFLFNRALENGCANSFLHLTRNKGAFAATQKDTGWALEERTVFLASGEYNLKYFKMEGRLQLDLYTLFRRDFQLESYKLDHVSAHFIGDMVTGLEAVEGGTRIRSNNLKGVEKTNYVLFEVVGHTNTDHADGEKFRVLEVGVGYMVVAGVVPPAQYLRWCLAKDDVDHHDIFRMAKGSDEDRAVIATYCIQDCNLVHHLMQKIDLLTSLIEMGSICSVPLEMLVMRGQGIKLHSLLAKKCRDRDILMPVSEYCPHDDGYEGAIVLDPKCGVYKDPVFVLDFNSLYPSIIIGYNLSSDSKVRTRELDLQGTVLKESGHKEKGAYTYDDHPGYAYCDHEFDIYSEFRKTPKAKVVKVKKGVRICRFAQFPEGKAIMPTVLEGLLSARKATRRLMEEETDDFMRNILDKRQLAYKVTANSLYGQCGAKTSAFYDKDVAACCTAMGRKLLQYAKTVLEEVYQERVCETSFGTFVVTAEYVYGDTDSVFGKFTLRKDGELVTGHAALPITMEIAKEAAHLISMFLPNPVKIEYEKTLSPLILLSKKRYVGLMYENDPKKCKRKSMGIVLKRRDNAPIVKDIYGGVIDILLDDRDVDRSLKFVRGMLGKLKAGALPLEKLIITKSLRSGYKNPKSIAHKVLADRIGERDQGNQPRPGDRMQFIFIKGAKKGLQGDRIETPAFIKAHNLPIDYAHYVTNQVMKPLQQVFGLVLDEMPGYKPIEGTDKKVEQHKMAEVKRLVFAEFL